VEGEVARRLTERYGSFGGDGGVGTADVAVETTVWTVLGALETVF
jgi:hypothetical protein